MTMNSRFKKPVKRLYQQAKVGVTAGWTVNAAANTFMSTCAASASGGTLIVPLPGLEIGDRIVGHHMVGQIESAGGSVAIAAKIAEFKAVAAASEANDKTGTTGTTLTVTADTAMTEANTKKTIDDANVVLVEDGKTYFAIITVTNDGSTDVELLGFVLHIIKGE